MTRLSETEKTIAKLLIDLAIRKTSIPYSDLARVMEREHGVKINEHFGLSKPLGNIAILCNELDLPLLSVRIEYKNNPNKTAEGFYGIACELKPEYKLLNPNEVRSKELELTKKCSEWRRLLDYLDGKQSSPSQAIVPSVNEQMASYVEDMISRNGIGCNVSTQEIVTEIMQRFDTNRNSIMPYDYCYNRYSKNLMLDRPLYFEHIGRGQYRIWGMDYPYNGDVFAHPQGGEEHIIGYCINGQQYLGAPTVYPDEYPDDSLEYREGKKKTVTINTFERNPAARSLCIEHYGSICFICGFDFGKTYGEKCKGMIHVHHLTMISEADNEYIVDPINDLRPVCPNCHMVLHSIKEGYTIEDIKSMLKR